LARTGNMSNRGGGSGINVSESIGVIHSAEVRCAVFSDVEFGGLILISIVGCTPVPSSVRVFRNPNRSDRRSRARTANTGHISAR
jgi:hypothetical protein